jgi:tRNA(Met) cytidine acetyltransferase
VKLQESFRQLGKDLHHRAEIFRHRYCVVLSGNAQWGKRSARELCSTYSRESVLLVGDCTEESADSDNTNTLAIGQTGTVLGREFDAVIYDCFSGFDADAAGILGGTIRAGGLLVLVVPAVESWPEFDDPQYARIVAYGDSKPGTSNYITRLIRVISGSPDCILIREKCDLPVLPQNHPANQAGAINYADQEVAVAAIKKVVTGHRRRPVVLLADRGRGKSAALGIAAAQLLQGQTKRIGVTGSNRQSVDCVFKHARIEGLPNEASIQFLAVDKLLESKAKIDLLLVDEAASIPVSMLKKLLDLYPRIAFASTVHGYEGTGRGFILQFKSLLDAHSRGWKSCVLKSPIRWAPEDPLEQFLFDALVLDAEPQYPSIDHFVPSALEISAIAQSDLADNEALTRNIFGLLVQAHYRTRPFDLRHILDARNLRIFTIGKNQHILGVAVVALEGGFELNIARKIWANHTRPNGHLLPELLCAQLGLLEAAQLRFARIMRIVIHPEFHRQGIGKQLLSEISSSFKGDVDLLGTTFSMSSTVLNFWLDSNYTPVRIGHTLSQNTGSHSCTLLRFVSNRGSALVDQAVTRFSTNLGYQLNTSLSGVEPGLVPPVYGSIGKFSSVPELQENEILELAGFAFSNQGAENIPASLARLADFTLKSNVLDSEESESTFLVERILQGKPWQNCTSLHPPGGKKQGIIALRKIVGKILRTCYPNQVSAIIKEYAIEI